MSLSEMKETTLHYLGMGLAGQENTAHVSRVVLSALMIPVKNDPESCYIVPVWVVAYTPEKNIVYLDVPEILVFDAITGAFIRPFG